MTEIILVILTIGLLLYILLGGADFGAGVLELITGRKGMDILKKAIAPIWEANHVWLILVIVVLFVGFPPVYSTIMLTLHIPVLLVLIGIILRGSAFAFRSYDIEEEKWNKTYSNIYKISSLITSFFFGVTLGAIILGNITLDLDEGFYNVYIRPWLNVFCVAVGIFITSLFTFLASVYTIGEVQKEDEELHILFTKISKIMFFILVAAGLLVFVAAEINNFHLMKDFLSSPVSIASIIVATACIPFLWKSFGKKNIARLRIIAGIQTVMIVMGWFAIQLPVIIKIKNSEGLTIYNAAAPASTQHHMLIALIVGILIIFPSFGYLFWTFKFKKNREA